MESQDHNLGAVLPYCFLTWTLLLISSVDSIETDVYID